MTLLNTFSSLSYDLNEKTQVTNSSYPHLILHFDVNKTIINTDSVTGKTKEEVLINQIAETTIYTWDPRYPKMSYKDYVYQVLISGEDSSQEIKRKRRAMIQNFLETLTLYPEIQDEVSAKYRQLEQKATDSIFNSFIKLIEKLQASQINFTLILRTFGHDLDAVSKEISKKTAILFNTSGKFEKDVLHLSGSENKIIATTQEIFNEFVKNSHMAIQDDYHFWNSHGELAVYGKKFVFESEGTTDLSLFFDDNLTGKDQDIVAPYQCENKFVETVNLMNKKLFCVDTGKAILEDDYYIKLISQALIENGYAGLKA